MQSWCIAILTWTLTEQNWQLPNIKPNRSVTSVVPVHHGGTQAHKGWWQRVNTAGKNVDL